MLLTYLLTYILVVGVCVCLKDPRVTSVSPSYGPKDGGTLITLTGTHLDAGLNQHVLINSLTCIVNRCVYNVICR